MFRAHLALLLAVLLSTLTGCGRAAGAQATPTATATAFSEPSSSSQPAPVRIVTPPPMQAEAPLTDAGSSVPSIFAGVKTYAPVQAALTSADANEWRAATIAEAARAVVQIRRCDAFGCTTPTGSGVIIHRSGLVLTAFHVLISDPDDPNSSRYTDFVIATTANIRNAPQPRFRAHIVATKDEQDLALLAIDRADDGQPLDPRTLQLPALPLADVDALFGEELHVLGFPVSGGEAVNYDQVNFRSFDDGGRVIVVNQALGSGNSGGPALVVRDGGFAVAGLVIRRRSSQNRLSPEGLLRAIDQAGQMTWSPNAPRAWAEGVQATSDGNLLQLTLRLNTFDLVGEPLRIFFYTTDAANGQPWQPAGFAAPLVVWADVTPEQVFAHQALTLTLLADELGATPERLHFHPLLWDVALGDKRWEAVAEGVPVVHAAVEVAPTGSQAATPTAVATATQTNTATPSPTATPTPNLPATQTADAEQFAAALAATLAARVFPTPAASATPNFEQRLATAVAATLMAEVTPTPTGTATFTAINSELADWTGEYWSNENLIGSPAIIRSDQTIDFNWGAGSPSSGIATDSFSVRWRRLQNFVGSTYRFYARADDGIRVWADGNLIIDEWRANDFGDTYSADLFLEGNAELRVEYFEHVGSAAVRFWWERIKE